ncbi:WbqC family protein [Hoeflea sp.]|uniref:WbqC family protein n=1 Tax=Hoeflea sp. TaxID=1940281 RepID=UPI003B51EE1A
MRVVISQSMYFPWVGMLEQIRLADVFIHYDDVQFTRRAFSHRIKVKTPNGTSWMTVPLQEHSRGPAIDEVKIQPPTVWADRHLALLDASIRGAPFEEDAKEIARSVLQVEHETVRDVARASMLSLCRYFEIDRTTRFVDSRDLGIGGSGSDRILNLVQAVGGTDYVTGHGARNYLDHEMFEAKGISVSYMDYQCTPYPQLHGPFTPYVTALDLVANCGRDGIRSIASGTRNWKEFTDGSS